MPGNPDVALASMGIYVFDSEYLYRAARGGQRQPDSEHDFGKDIIPRAVAEGRALAHPFGMSCVTRDRRHGANAYWRDVGTIDAFWAANLDLASITPELDIYDTDWPIWTYQRQLPPAKFVLGHRRQARHDRQHHRLGRLHRVGLARCADSVLFSGVRVHSFCEIDEAVLLPDVRGRPRRRLKQGGDRPRLRHSRRAW